eukprot:s289_g1.t1
MLEEMGPMLWATVVTIINYRANSIASYEVRSGVIQSLRDIQAVPTRGVAPAEVQVGKDLGLQQGGSSCSCTCAVFRSDLCETAEPERRHDFQGTISLGHIAELRAQAAYFQDLGDGVDGNVSWNGLRWDDIRSRDDVLMWLQHGLLPVLWNEVGRDTPVHVGNMFDSNAESILADRANPGIFNHWMQIVGGVRMRQRRLQSVPCHGIDARLQERYSPNCYSDILQVQPYGPGLGSIAEGFVPQEEGVLGAYDVRLNLGTPFREILENFEYMLKYHNWIDDASHSLQIQAAMVHGEATPPFFVMFEVRFDFRRSGFVAKDLNIFLTATDMFPTTLEIVLHVLWALMLFSLLFSQSFKEGKGLVAAANETPLHHQPEIRRGGLACCGMRPKAAEADAAAEAGEEKESDSKGPKKVIWDTADLTWWDFYKRRWTTLWLMRNVYTRYKAEQTEGLPEGPQREAIWQECHAISAVELKRHAEEAKGLFIKAGQDIFCEFDPEPLASASIAQVQHDGVDRIFLEDIETLTAVAEQLAAWWPDLDFRKFAEEWRESLPRELDFTHERTALERAGKALREAANWCVVPKVHPALCGPHVFVMEFIDAGPILDLGDAKFCEENKVDKHRVLEELIHAFGIMAFRDGMFHADPHAGNVRLKVDANAPGGARPVLLDWGLIREITDEERLGLAKVFHSLANFDIAGLFDVLENRAEKGEDVSLSPIHFLEDWPRCIIFFLRMLQILRGLCISVDAEGMPMLQIFSSHAKGALQEGSQKNLLSSTMRIYAGRDGRKRGEETPFTSKASVKKSRALEARVESALQRLLNRRQIVGAQVAVVRAGDVICSVACGSLSSIDARPVTEKTRFPLLGATAGIGSLAFLRALHRHAEELIAKSGDDSLRLATLLRRMLVSDQHGLLQTVKRDHHKSMAGAHHRRQLPGLGPGLEPPDGKTIFGIIPQDDQPPSVIAQRMREAGGMAPAGYTIFIEIPMRSGDRWRLQNFMSAAQLAPVVVSAEPFSNMSSLQLSDAQELAGFCRRYEEAGGAGCLLRYAHEMNGAWYPWCQRPSEFRSTFRMLAGAIHAITARSGMVWSVNEGSGYPFSGGTYSCQQGMSCFSEVDTNGDGVFDKFDDPYAPYYPGDDVVDWVGITVYSWGLQYPFGENQLPQDNYFVNRIRGNYVGPAGDYRSTPDFYLIYCSPQGGHNKPMMLTESSALYAVGAPFGGTAGNMDIKRNWWMQVFGLTACPPSSLCGGAEFPMLKGILWFDVIKREDAAQNATVDWSVTQNTSMAQNFAQDVLNQPGGRERYMGLDELNEMRGCANDDVDNCAETKCCVSPGSTCYKKDDGWAACMASCVPGIDYSEPQQYQTPWSCEDLSEIQTCSADRVENCAETRCCTSPGSTCYKKDDGWATCMASCVPGIDYSEPPQYQTPWSCEVLSAPTSIPTLPPTLPPTTPPTSPPVVCSEDRVENCGETRCCTSPGSTCYKKDDGWATCMASCVPGIDYTDPPQYQTPWSCEVLSAPTSIPTLPPTLPPTTPPTSPPVVCSEDRVENCGETRCCTSPGSTCYKKDDGWATCMASCVPGIDYSEPPQYQTPWSCEVLSAPTSIPTLPPTQPPTTPPTSPPVVCSEDRVENCGETRCCTSPGSTCYKKDDGWATCMASCVPGIDYTDPPQQIWPDFAASSPDISLADLLAHRVGLQDAFPVDFHPSSLDDLRGMASHLEADIAKKSEDSRYAYLLQSFVLAKLGDCIGGQDDFLHWLGAELGPLGLDVALPAGRGKEAAACRDLPDLARVSLQEVRTARNRRRQQAEEPASEEDGRDDGGASNCSSPKQAHTRARTLLQAMARDPLVFDPLQANASAGGMFRGGLSMTASARGLAEMLASAELSTQLEELNALALEGVDKTALGWLLSGGGTHWTAGGLQALDLRGTGSRALRTYRQSGYGVICGLGPSVAHFPELAPGGVTVAVLVNDVLHGRQAAAELMRVALSEFSVAPAWPDLTLNVLADARQMAQSPDAAPLMESVGGVEGLRKMLNLYTEDKSEADSRCVTCRDVYLQA